MNFVLKTIFALSCITLFSACGIISENASFDGQASNNLNFDAKTAYVNLPAPDMSVGSGYTAVITEQRESSTHFCRRSQSVGASVYQYVCYQVMNSGAQAQATFNTLQGSFGSYSVSIGNFVGSSSIHEITDGPMYGGGQTLCQKITPQNPSAAVTYRCFSKL
jgi:hypothetical protein